MVMVRGVAGRARTRLVPALLLVGAVLGVLVPATMASAHAIVVGIDPPDGAVLAQAPEAVTVYFTEAVTLAPAGNAVLDAEAADIDAAVEVVGEEVRFGLPDGLAEGTYVVTWQVISVDSHPVRGSSLFHVGRPSASAPTLPAIDDSGAPGVTPLGALADAVVYASALIAVGAGWFARRWGTTAGAAVDRLVVRAAVVGLVALVPAVGLRVVRLGGQWSAAVDLQAVASTVRGPIGWSAALVAVGLVAQGLAGRVGRARLVAWGVGAFAIVAAAAVEGHTRSASPRWLALVADATHVGAAAIWVGGVAALLVARSAQMGEWRVAAVDVSGFAVAAVAAVTVAGVAMAATIAPDASALTSTRWGWAVIAKAAVAAVLVGVGWYHRYRVLPQLGRTGVSAAQAGLRLRATLGAELALFAVVLGATGVAVGSSPMPSDGRVRPAYSSYLQTVSLSSGVGSVSFALAPAAVGYNDLNLQITDTAGGPLELLWDPTVELAEQEQEVGPIDLVVHDLGGGSYHVPVQVPFAGRWELRVRARTDTFESGDAVATIDID